MTSPAELELAYSVPCPNTACGAFLGEQCVSYATGRALADPHRQRVQAAREQIAADAAGSTSSAPQAQS